MSKTDSNGNLIQATWFETQLSKIILEQTDLYQGLYQKINASIFRVLKANAQNQAFERILFSSISSLLNYFPDYDKPEKILASPGNIWVMHHFHKVFFETLLPLSTHTSSQLDTKQSSSAVTSILRPYLGKTNWREILDNTLMSEENFSDQKRGRILLEISYSKASLTQKFGIMSPKYTPKNLQEFFAYPFTRLQDEIKPDEKTAFVEWLRAKKLPFVGGLSGTTLTNIVGMAQLEDYSLQEIRLYAMILAACMVARGFHSFVEVFKALNLLGVEFEEYSNRQQFYEQFLTAEFKQTQAYLEFIHSSQACDYLEQKLSPSALTL